MSTKNIQADYSVEKTYVRIRRFDGDHKVYP